MIRIFHAADLHLGRLRKARQPLLHTALRENFLQMINRAIEEKIDIILLAGDLLDDRSEEPREELFLLDAFSRAASNGIDIYICTGNHDSHLHAPLWREHVYLFDSPEPQIIEKERYRIVSQGHLQGHDLRTTLDLPRFSDTLPTFGLLHSQVYDGEIPDGARYHPTRLRELIHLGYDYLALGHEHSFRLLHHHSPIVYSGSLSHLHPFDTSTKGYVDYRWGEDPLFVPSTGVLFQERILAPENSRSFAAKEYPELAALIQKEPRLFLILTLEGHLPYREKESILRMLHHLPMGRFALRDQLQISEEPSNLPQEILEALCDFAPPPMPSLMHSKEEMTQIYRENPALLSRILAEAMWEEEA